MMFSIDRDIVRGIQLKRTLNTMLPKLYDTVQLDEEVSLSWEDGRKLIAHCGDFEIEVSTPHLDKARWVLIGPVGQSNGSKILNALNRINYTAVVL